MATSLDNIRDFTDETRNFIQNVFSLDFKPVRYFNAYRRWLKVCLLQKNP